MSYFVELWDKIRVPDIKNLGLNVSQLTLEYEVEFTV